MPGHIGRYLQQLNPSLLRMTTPKDQTFTLNLPAGTKDKYETAIALIPPDMRTFWRYHRVEYGESLGIDRAQVPHVDQRDRRGQQPFQRRGDGRL